jgi:hypothetical protein
MLFGLVEYHDFTRVKITQKGKEFFKWLILEKDIS